MKIKPLHDHVIVSRLESEEKTPGGIIIPDTAKEKPQEGKVLAVGPGRLGKEGNRITPEVKEGDKVLFTKWGGTEVKIDGRELMIMKEDDILAVLE
ncbi:MAG TPA: co-chaperone GroES [Smithellaceae bacterium]|jgi:chaperonin GroES|nr:co-chaperone GroES [Syntrophaceae bacterium]MBP8608951.1 co-chaperone GroES [Syntrophaceae bacterium]MDX9817090.1 co-chaperone GroES [Smithellaceae bacterium]NMD04595.1 co-chaperone GroES [Deltaproteobacteria bacterium]HOZ62419.1 co-chaperone GroES [Smithellaceae bacterium]